MLFSCNKIDFECNLKVVGAHAQYSFKYFKTKPGWLQQMTKIILNKYITDKKNIRNKRVPDRK